MQSLSPAPRALQFFALAVLGFRSAPPQALCCRRASRAAFPNKSCSRPQADESFIAATSIHNNADADLITGISKFVGQSNNYLREPTES